MFTVGLSKRTTSEGLREAFSKFGEIVQGIIRSFHIYKHVKLNKQLRLFLVNEFALSIYTARVVTDRVSGYSKGFGFVKYCTIREAEEGIKGMDGKVS